MLFNVFASALALSATAYSAPTPQGSTIVSAQGSVQVNAVTVKPILDGLKDKATAIQAPINLLNAISATEFVTGAGPFPAVINGIQDIAVNAQGLAVLLQNARQIPAGDGANSVIAAYQAFAQAQQVALNALNTKLNANPPTPQVAAPLSAVLQNLQVGVTNLFNQLSARLATPAAPTPVPAPETNALSELLSSLTSTLNALLAGLNVQALLNTVTNTIGQITGNLALLSNLPVQAPAIGTGAVTGGGLQALPFGLPLITGVIGGLNLGTLPLLGTLLGGLGNGLNLGNLPILGGLTGGALNLGSLPVLGGLTGTVGGVTGGVTGGGATAPVNGLLGNLLGGNGKGLLGGILAKRA